MDLSTDLAYNREMNHMRDGKTPPTSAIGLKVSSADLHPSLYVTI